MIRNRQLGEDDRIATAGGTFVRWWEIPRFEPLRAVVGHGAPAAAPAPGPAVRTTPNGSPSVARATPAATARAVVRPADAAAAVAAGGSAAGARASQSVSARVAPIASVREADARRTAPSAAPAAVLPLNATGAASAGVSRGSGAIDTANAPPARQGAGPARTSSDDAERARQVEDALGRLRDQRQALARASAAAPAMRSMAGEHDPFPESYIEAGPVALRDALLRQPVVDILGVTEETPRQVVARAFELRVHQLDRDWDSEFALLRLPSQRAARLDVMRVLGAAHRFLTQPDDRQHYDERARVLRRRPLLGDLMEFTPATVQKEPETESISANDAAILDLVGFDVAKLQALEEQTPAEAAAEKRRRFALQTGPPPAERRNSLLGVLAICALMAGFSIYRNCLQEVDDGGFRQIAGPEAIDNALPPTEPASTP